MTQVLDAGNGILNLGAISKEEDLTPKCRFLINGPPLGGRCEVCGRHISGLKPFGGPGDPLVGDFDGELLVKRWRRDAPYDEEAAKAWGEARKEAEEVWKEPGKSPLLENPNEDHFLGWFIGKYGREKGLKFYYWEMLWGGVSKSWECRDCIVLDEDEYYKEIRKKPLEEAKKNELPR